MSRLDAIAILSTGIISSLFTLSLRTAPVLGQTESVSNARQERILPAQSNSEYQPVVFAADISSDNVENQFVQNVTILGLAAIGASTGGLIWSLNRQNTTLKPQTTSKQHGSSIEQANPRLKKQLLRLVGGDSQTANRLVVGVKKSHPGKSINWIVEKAIYDLERDRD